MLIHDPYYDIKAVSNSSLSHINPDQEGTPSKFKANWDGTAPSLRTASLEFGNLVHLAVLEPHLLNYTVDKTNTPDKIRDIVNTVFKNVKPEPDPFALEDVVLKEFDTYYPAIMSAVEEHNYGANWKEDTRLRKVLESGGSYFQTLAEAHNQGKFVITSTMEERLNHVIMGIQRDNYGKRLLEQTVEKDVEYYNEQEVQWTDEKYSFPLKGKIDRLRVDHMNREFTVIDLKTTAKKLANFRESFEKYHYARQMAAYIKAASVWCEQEFGQSYKPTHRHIIVAVETSGDYRCGRFLIKNKTCSAGKEEFESLLDRLNYHFQSNDWINDKEYAEQQCYSI